MHGKVHMPPVGSNPEPGHLLPRPLDPELERHREGADYVSACEQIDHRLP